jgi:Tol biopolymer transport system component
MRSILGLFVVATALAAVPDARASFPGRDGRLVVTGCHALPGDEMHRWRATLTTLRADGTHRRVIRSFAPVPPEDRCRVVAARWSPDGTRLTYTDGRGVNLADAHGRDLRLVLADDAWAAGWAPDGRRLVAPIDRHYMPHSWALAIVDSRRAYPMPLAPVVRARTGWYDQVDSPSWRPTGRYIAFSRMDYEPTWPAPRYRVCRLDLSRGRERCLSGGMRPEYSPDGRRIAFLDGGEVWTMRADGSHRRRLTRLSDRPGRPAPVNAVWSPDGRRIAYVARESTWEATGELRVIGAGGRGDHRIASGDELGRLGNVDWQPR